MARVGDWNDNRCLGGAIRDSESCRCSQIRGHAGDCTPVRPKPEPPVGDAAPDVYALLERHLKNDIVHVARPGYAGDKGDGFEVVQIPVWAVRQALAQRSESRADVIEECAKVVESKMLDTQPLTPDRWLGYNAAVKESQAALRALAQSPEVPK